MTIATRDVNASRIDELPTALDGTRALSSGRDGLRVLCVGGTPGEAYQPPDWSEV